MKIKSKAQAGFLAMIAGRKATKKGGPTPAKAGKMLAENRGMKMRDLPERAPARAAKRVSRRGGR